MKLATGNMKIKPSKTFMQLAIKEAQNAKEAGCYAIGAVIVKDNEIISKAGNRVKLDQDPTHHAEVVAIRQAAQKQGVRHLENCILYTTHEPCPMCTAAAIFARMKGIVSGSKIADMAEFRNNHSNGDWSWRTIDIPASEIINKGHTDLQIIEEFMRAECKKLFHTE